MTVNAHDMLRLLRLIDRLSAALGQDDAQLSIAQPTPQILDELERLVDIVERADVR